MSERSREVPRWFPYLDLACAALAGGVWYAFPQAGPWPLVLALAPWALRWVLAGQITRHTAFDLSLAAFLVTASVAVWAAYDRQAAWTKFWIIIGGVLLFYALANAQPIGDARVWLLAAFGTGVSLCFLATHDWDSFPAKIGALNRLGVLLRAPLPSLPGHRLHPNVAGGIMAMMLPFTSYLALKSLRALGAASGKSRSVPWLVLGASLGMLAVTAFGLLMTTSRGAWLALASAVLLAVLWALSGWLSRGDTERRTWIFPGLLVLGLVGCVLLGVAWPGGINSVLDALPGGNTTAGRADLLRNTWTLVRDYPFIGAGLGGFQMLYSTYVLLLHVGFSVHSHNLFLNVAVEQGGLALLCLVWMWVLFAAAVWRGLLRSDELPGSSLLGAAALSLVVILLHGLVDDALYGSRGLLLMFIPLAFAVPFFPRREGAHHWVGLAFPVGIVLLLALAVLWRGPVLSSVYSNLGAVHQGQAELGVYSWPEWPVQDAVRREVDLRRPIAEFERALIYDPTNPSANRRLGMIELSLGEYARALDRLEAAYAVEPASVTTRQLLGEALIVNGRVDEGQALWADLSNAQKQLSVRAFWYEHIGEAERVEWIRQAIGSR